MAELILNPSFETPGAGGTDVFANWYEAAGDGAIDQAGGTYHSGSYSAKLTAGPTLNARVTQNVAAVPSAWAKVSFWTRGYLGNAGRYGLYDVTGDAYVASLASTGVTGDTWTEVVKWVIVPAGCTELQLRFYCPAVDGGICYFDDASISLHTLTWEVYAGDGPGWMDVSGHRLVFGGSARNIDVPLAAGEWQRGTHLGTSDPGIDACGLHHVPNTRYVTSATWDGGAGEAATSEAGMAQTDCTLRVRLTTTLAAAVNGATLFVHDPLSTAARAEGLKVCAFQRGAAGRNYWTVINDGDAGIGGAGQAFALDDSAAAEEHIFYVALSAAIQRYDILPAFNIGFQWGEIASHVQGFVNFCTGDPEYELWVLDDAQQRRFLIDEIPAGLHWEKAERGWSSFDGLRVNVNSPAYAWLRAFEMILIRRGRHDLFVALNEKPTAEMPENLEEAATYTALGRSLNALLERRRCVPLDGDDYLDYTGHPDDAAKYMVRYNFCDTYAEREGDAGRAWPSYFGVQPARGECPEDAVVANRTYKYNHEQSVGDACADLASRYGLDYEVKCDGEGRLDFETYWPFRGANRAEGNPEGNRQVVFTVDRENLRGVTAYKDRLKVYNVVYVLGSGQGASRLVVACKDETSIAMYGRREGVLSLTSSDTDVLTQKGQTMLAINGYPVEGVTFTFRQSGALKYGRDFDVGDYVGLYVGPLQVDLQDNWRIKRVAGTLVERGEVPGQIVEELEITLGKDEPALAADQAAGSGGGGAGPIVSLHNPTTIQPDDMPDPGDPDDPIFPELASILHVHGIVTNAPYDTGGRETNMEDLYALDNPGDADMEFVRRSHQHAIFDNVTPEAVGAGGTTRVNTSDNHAAYRSHQHWCARYNTPASHTHTNPDTGSAGAHSHINPDTASSGAHTHTQAATGAEAAHTHTNPNTNSAGGHTHLSGGITYAEAAHTHTNPDTASAGAHTHTQAATGAEAAHTHTNPDVSSAGAHTHLSSGSSYAEAAHTHTNPDTASGGAHTHTQAATGAEAAHTHTNPNTNSTGGHVHTQGNTGAEAAHTHTNPNVASAGGHTHIFTYQYANASHCHAIIGHVKLKGYVVVGGTTYNVTFLSDGTGHEAPIVGGTASDTQYCFIRLDGFITGGTSSGDITSAGAHTHAQGATGAGSSHTHTNPDTATSGAHVHTQAATGAGSSHAHTNPDTASGGAHTHTQEATGAGSSHTHVILNLGSNSAGDHIHTQAATGAGSSHAHTNPDTASGGAHSHTQAATGAGSSHAHVILNLASNSAGDHSHMQAATGAGSSHAHTNPETAFGGAHSHTQAATESAGDHAHTQGPTGAS